MRLTMQPAPTALVANLRRKINADALAVDVRCAGKMT